MEVSTQQSTQTEEAPITLFVANLPTEATEAELETLFSQIGPVQSRHKQGTTAHVAMADPTLAERAIQQLNGQLWQGHALLISPQTPGPRAKLTPKLHEVIQEIAAALGETEPDPVKKIEQIVRSCGVAFAQALLRQTQAIEEAGGILTHDKRRRRTPGGVFFYLAHGNVSKAMRSRLMAAPGRGKGAPQPSVSPAGPAPAQPKTQSGFVWAERGRVFEVLQQQKGIATTVKITVIGRPGKLEERADLVMILMESQPKPLSLPKGVPQMPETSTTYAVYIAAKQWKKVSQAIQSPEDALIVEGYCAYDAALPGIAVYASNVTTKQLDAAKRTPKQAQTPTPDNVEQSVNLPTAPTPAKLATPPAPVKATPAVQPKPTPPATPAAPPAKPSPPPIHQGPPPPDVVKKLAALRQAEQMARQVLDAIKAQLPEEQQGMGKALQEVRRLTDEIKALKQQYPKLL